MTDWRWEYEPNAHHVIGGIDDLGFIARVEERADELVRMAVVLYLESTAYEGTSPRLGEEVIEGGMLVYQIVPRHERVYILQTTIL